MRPRERVLRAVLREEVDAVPISMWVEWPQPARSLMDALNADTVERMLEKLEVEYRGFLPNISWLGVGLKGGYEERWFTDEQGRRCHRNIFGVVTAFSSDGRTSMYVEHPLQRIDVREYAFPEVREEDFDSVEKFRRLHEDYCVIAATLQPFETACALFGYNLIYRLMLREPWKVEYVLDRLFAVAEQQAKLLAEAGVDQVYGGDDVGAQTTMLISPQLWRRFLKPRYRRLADAIHKRGAFFHFHSDGWIEPIIPDLIEVGVDVLEPLQPECMNLKQIKERYGDELSFEGGIGVQRLPFMKTLEVADEVRRVLEAMGPTGFTLRPSHTILPETPLENILALYESANKLRRLSKH